MDPVGCGADPAETEVDPAEISAVLVETSVDPVEIGGDPVEILVVLVHFWPAFHSQDPALCSISVLDQPMT